MGLRLRTLSCILILAGCFPPALLARSGKGTHKAHAPMFVEVYLGSAVKFSSLKPGDVLRGKIARNVFSGYRLILPGGSRVSLRVSGMEQRRKESNSIWPWPASHFRLKYKEFPTIDLLTVSLPGGAASFPVSLVSAYNEVHVTAQTLNGRKSKKAPPATAEKSQSKGGQQASGSALELVIKGGPLESARAVAKASSASPSSRGTLPDIPALAPGTETRLALMCRLSSSKSRTGESFQAMLAEPLRLSSGKILPEGSLFEGHVRRSNAPRWLSRPGSLYLSFNRLILPTGASLPIAASVIGVETTQHSQMKVGTEGRLSGGSPGKRRLLVNLGVGFGISKVADDGYQLVAEALVSTATDASTAGTARLVGMALGGFFFIKRHGRDVVLPPYTMINVRFDRSPSLVEPETQEWGMR